MPGKTSPAANRRNKLRRRKLAYEADMCSACFVRPRSLLIVTNGSAVGTQARRCDSCLEIMREVKRRARVRAGIVPINRDICSECQERPRVVREVRAGSLYDDHRLSRCAECISAACAKRESLCLRERRKANRRAPKVYRYSLAELALIFGNVTFRREEYAAP
jgi:hypothetical protein